MKKLLIACLLAAMSLTSCGERRLEIENRGSDTLLEVAGSLAQAYRAIRPELAISVSGGGSGGGIAALIAGDVGIANASRPLKKEEVEAAKKMGNNPVEHIVGYDGIAIFVHKDNPIKSLTIAQLDSIFGEGGKVTSWKDLGIDLGSDKANEMVLGSRSNSSGTYECFRSKVLGKSGRFKQSCRNLSGSKELVEVCGTTLGAIGYSGLAYANDKVRMVPVAIDASKKAVLPTIDTVLDKSYPIARPLYMYTNDKASKDINDYIAWIKGKDAQKILLDKKYVPLMKPGS